MRLTRTNHSYRWADQWLNDLNKADVLVAAAAVDVVCIAQCRHAEESSRLQTH